MDREIIVIIPTLNNEFHLERTLKSIPEDFEILIIDSGSADQTPAIAKKYTDNFIVREMISWDAGDQRNYAFNYVKNHYKVIMFLDSDEFLTDQLIQELRSLLSNSSLFFNILV